MKDTVELNTVEIVEVFALFMCFSLVFVTVALIKVVLTACTCSCQQNEISQIKNISPPRLISRPTSQPLTECELTLIQLIV